MTAVYMYPKATASMNEGKGVYIVENMFHSTPPGVSQSEHSTQILTLVQGKRNHSGWGRVFVCVATININVDVRKPLLPTREFSYLAMVIVVVTQAR